MILFKCQTQSLKYGFLYIKKIDMFELFIPYTLYLIPYN